MELLNRSRLTQQAGEESISRVKEILQGRDSLLVYNLCLLDEGSNGTPVELKSARIVCAHTYDFFFRSTDLADSMGSPTVCY